MISRKRHAQRGQDGSVQGNDCRPSTPIAAASMTRLAPLVHTWWIFPNRTGMTPQRTSIRADALPDRLFRVAANWPRVLHWPLRTDHWSRSVNCGRSSPSPHACRVSEVAREKAVFSGIHSRLSLRIRQASLDPVPQSALHSPTVNFRSSLSSMAFPAAFAHSPLLGRGSASEAPTSRSTLASGAGDVRQQTTSIVWLVS